MAFGSWWRRLRGHDDKERGIHDEFTFHLEQETAKNVRAGMTSAEARRAALLRFGGVEASKERARDEFRPALVQDFWRDVRVGARMLTRTPAVALTIILTFGLGVGAATAVFSVVNGVLLEPLSYPQPDRIVRLYQVDKTGARNRNVSDPNFDDWQARTRSFAAMATMAGEKVPVLGAAEPLMATVSVVSRDFFTVMGEAPVIGRSFLPDEQKVGGAPAAIVSRAFWMRWLDGGSGGSLSGRTLRVGDRTYAVVGVMPADFDYPDGTAIWVPRELDPPYASRTAHNSEVVARVRDGVSMPSAQADISAVSRALKQIYGNDTWMSDAAAVPLLDQITASSRPALELLFGAALLLLLVANTNVSSLLLARTSARRHEFAVQLAIGAGRGRIARQLVAETLVMCVAGGAFGALLAVWAVRAMITLGPAVAPRLASVHVNWVALAFALVASTISAVVLGVLTTVGLRDVHVTSALADGHRTGTAGRRSLAMRQTLVVTQVALTVVLLAGAGLLARSLTTLLHVNPGFRVDGAIVVDVTLTHDDAVQRRTTIDTLLDKLGRLPGVTRVGATTGFPIGGGYHPDGQFIEMTSLTEIQRFEDIAKLGPAIQARTGYAGYRVASAGYFQAMGIPLIRGRLFDDRDTPDSPDVAVVSQSLADAKWPHQDPIGRFVQFGNMDGDLRGLQIVGVVGEVREVTLESPSGPVLYASYRQRPSSAYNLGVVIRTPDTASIAPAVRRAVQETDPELPIRMRTLTDLVDTAVAGRRFSLVLIGVFAASALLLATLGLYGLISYLVAQRTREMGIRIALGARPISLVGLIVGRGALLAIYGSLAGLIGAFAASRLLRDWLFEVRPTDPAVLGGVVAVTIAAAAWASYWPARRAARIQPIAALRGD